MSALTNSNAFKEELDQAIKDARSALDDVALKLNKYIETFTNENSTETPVATPPVVTPTPVVAEEPVIPVVETSPPTVETAPIVSK